VESAQALSAAITRLRAVHLHAVTRTTVVLRTVFERPRSPLAPTGAGTRPRALRRARAAEPVAPSTATACLCGAERPGLLGS